MSDYKKALRERYASAADDELRRIAISSDLTQEAKEILAQELLKRGIDDIEEYKKQMQREGEQRQRYRNESLNRKEKGIRFYARVGYSVSLLIIVVGFGRWFIKGNSQDGEVMVLTGIGTLLFIWATSLLRRLWWRLVFRS